MTSTQTAEAPNVAAFTANASAGGPSSISTPPSAGPAMIPAPVTAARAALAPGRSAPATSRGVVAATDGRYGVAAAVASAAITGARTTGRFAAATSASASIRASLIRSQATITRRRSKRSATMPPNGPSTTIGTIRAAVVTPAHIADPVRW